ncbi:Hypothetical predicted protein [Cloeon dipterum]|uniref:DNA/RNA non-specific endonuclease/pyrophosphatase/phosphodiesterase domain-containing protein n=2 Tax=Cloeon dipterum TaxID=197152 RepID=A0A8S1CGW3_9INSE|nr:Hypothetical predicted protein [Cloeon dipterum]
MVRTVALVALLALALQNQGAHAICIWYIETGLPTPQPLYINPSGPLDIHGFWLPERDDLVLVPTGSQVLFACPGGLLPATGTSEVLLTCVDGDTFSDELGNTYLFNLLMCTTTPTQTARRVAGASCGNNSSNSVVEIGFEISNGNFYSLLEICFNEVTYDSLYSKNIMPPEIDGRQTTLPDPDFFKDDTFYPPNLDLDYAYSVEGQTAAVAQAVGSASLAGEYISGLNVLQEGRLTSKRDNIYGLHQLVNAWYLNLAPQWDPIKDGNWDILQGATRQLAEDFSYDLIVYTGTHGTTTLADVNGIEKPIYIAYDESGNGLVRVPEFFWRIVYDPITQRGVAFVTINNPYISTPGSDFYLCPDVCNQIPWVVWDTNDFTKGYSYCCEVNALAPFVEEIPPLTVSGLLTGV